MEFIKFAIYASFWLYLIVTVFSHSMRFLRKRMGIEEKKQTPVVSPKPTVATTPPKPEAPAPKKKPSMVTPTRIRVRNTNPNLSYLGEYYYTSHVPSQDTYEDYDAVEYYDDGPSKHSTNSSVSKVTKSMLATAIVDRICSSFNIRLTNDERLAIFAAVNHIPESKTNEFFSYVNDHPYKSIFIFERCVNYIKTKQDRNEKVNPMEIYMIFKMVNFF